MYIRTSEGLGRHPTLYRYRTPEGRATNHGAAIVFEHPAPPYGTSSGLHGFGQQAVAAGPKADLVFDKFEFGFSLVPAAHKPAIGALADRIVALARRGPGPLGTVRLVGHTDYIDTEKYNKALGLMRAKAVRVALATALECRMRGVTSRIEIVPESKGELQWVTTDKSAAGRELNRRVEVFLSLNAPAPLPTQPTVRLPNPWEIDKVPEVPTGGPQTQRSDIEKVIDKYVPTGLPCVNPYQEIVKRLQKLLDRILSGSRIPKRYHNQIRRLAAKYARDRRDWVIDKGLDELDLRGDTRRAAKQLTIYAVENACF
jgi:outer membrane protein OmpA-like peptidoglycan-associated protein